MTWRRRDGSTTGRLWIALSLASWQLLAGPDCRDAERRAELAAAEARLRAALGVA